MYVLCMHRLNFIGSGQKKRERREKARQIGRRVNGEVEGGFRRSVYSFTHTHLLFDNDILFDSPSSFFWSTHSFREKCTF